MARQPQTRTAVLGVLAIEPLTGYEVRRVIGSVLGHFWHESFGQIYPCLAGLERDGLIASSPGTRSGSSRYEITDAGRRQLADLLTEPPTLQPPRNGVLLRVFFGHELGPTALAALIDDVEREARARLASYDAIRAGIAGTPEYAEHGRYWVATIRAGELSAEAQLVWAAETRTALDLTVS